jgi:hypothetical protein
MTSTVVEGVVEEVQAQQIGPGNLPGPLEPTVIDRVDAARELKKELRERYPGVAFKVARIGRYGRWLKVEYQDGPPEGHVRLIADAYVGYWYESWAPGDGGRYHPLPGRWVGTVCAMFKVRTDKAGEIDMQAEITAGQMETLRQMIVSWTLTDDDDPDLGESESEEVQPALSPEGNGTTGASVVQLPKRPSRTG